MVFRTKLSRAEERDGMVICKWYGFTYDMVSECSIQLFCILVTDLTNGSKHLNAGHCSIDPILNL